MAIRVALHHLTRYKYSRDVWLSPHTVRLRPAPHCRTPIVSYSMTVKPAGHFINWQQDPYSNRQARLVFPKKAREFSVEIDLVAEMTVINPFDFFLENYAETFPFQYDPSLKKELVPYTETIAPGPKLAALIAACRWPETRTNDFLVKLNQVVHDAVGYTIRLEAGIQTPEETLTKGTGSCRDSAWLLVQLMRHLGLAARFCSGYLIQLAPDVKSLDGPSGTEVDFTDLHAWTEVYLPGAGWIGLDPTSGLLTGEGHIPLACSADPSSASPITGHYAFDNEAISKPETDQPADLADGEMNIGGAGAGDEFEFHMSVTRVHEDPRVTKPYSDAQWQAIGTLGRQVDMDLARGDVRMTMGGEPTFVSIDDMEGPEWNTDALGPLKQQRGDELLRRLRDRFSTGGFLHHGQGKWYPGEALPRWAYGLYWRKDGQPIWRDKDLVADEYHPGNKADENDARHFMAELAKRLGVDPDHSNAAYEDAFYYLWKERRLPVNVDPFDSKLENKEDRVRLAKIFEQGMDRVIGYALPLARVHYTDGTADWESGRWFLRSERMYLIPGDSPVGYRLPLDSIPWVLKSDSPFVHERDPWDTRPPLPDYERMTRDRQRQRQLSIPGGPEPRNPVGYVEQVLPDDGPGDRRRERVPMPGSVPGPGVSDPNVIRTALCTQARNGVLRVFLPPQRHLEDFLDLIMAVEDTAEQLNLRVMVEGYPPPFDPRVNVIKVTPDPGVIEVNSAPVESWDDLVSHTTALYEEARLTRLGTEKFMLDGRHTGTGGGNHIVVGASTPQDSPFLRRPDLLKSLIGYWHNHPSLSYLFSGQFVGPTSQAPRADEARNDTVYELEIAFAQLDTLTPQSPPWMVDRILRNLLIDLTGNTHRAEFCIDKLYSPDSATGRLGLLELRAFEMPPHSRMSLTQHLLLRALIAHFWKTPYRQPLVRWHTEVHDRFMLPHFVEQDLADVMFDLREAGYAFDAAWFAPHLEFRFPHYGTIEQRGIKLDLHQAIEPWNVLGEEQRTGGTARYVDSSVERIQLKVRGMTDRRHVIACNGVRVPLHPTGTNGEFVAGVRYKAWSPYSALHPTIGIHSPLVFDILDTWNNRSVGGCTYHVVHPGGLSYATFPVNSYEAESRRVNRFYASGHTPGTAKVREPLLNKEFPFTLDLRHG